VKISVCVAWTRKGGSVGVSTPASFDLFMPSQS
jgi:hypothetical protein